VGCPGIGRGQGARPLAVKEAVLGTEALSSSGPYFPCQGPWLLAPALTMPMPPASAHLTPIPGSHQEF
jgi:hypothetical protein